MKKLFLLLTLTTPLSETYAQQRTTTAKTATVRPEYQIALPFINSYTAYSTKETVDIKDIARWIAKNPALTPAFKQAYKKILAAADPEMGLEADPVLDAQDSPDKGFSVAAIMDAQGYLTVHPVEKEWTDFNITLRMVQKNGKWFVDGCGVVNIPQAKQAKR